MRSFESSETKAIPALETPVMLHFVKDFARYLVKAIIAGDIDRMEALGIYEVAPEDFALCEFVCSSKVEVQRIVRAGLDMLRAEMA